MDELWFKISSVRVIPIGNAFASLFLFSFPH